jgi:hypothetical protein
MVTGGLDHKVQTLTFRSDESCTCSIDPAHNVEAIWSVTFSALRRLPGAPKVPPMKDITPTKPAKRALAALDQTEPAVDARVRQRRISKRVNAAIDLLVAGDVKTIKEAAEKAGLARESLSRALSTPHIAEHLRTKVMKSLAMAAARAGAVKTDLLDSDNAIARDRASSFVLGLAGIQPETTPSVSVNLEIKAGYVIDISDDLPAAMRVVPHE